MKLEVVLPASAVIAFGERARAKSLAGGGVDLTPLQPVKLKNPKQMMPMLTTEKMAGLTILRSERRCENCIEPLSRKVAIECRRPRVSPLDELPRQRHSYKQHLWCQTLKVGPSWWKPHNYREIAAIDPAPRFMKIGTTAGHRLKSFAFRLNLGIDSVTQVPEHGPCAQWPRN